MASTDFFSAGRVVPLLSPQSIAASTEISTLTPPAVDTKGWRWAFVVLQTGTVSATAAATITVQSGATSGGSFADITGASFTVAAADDDTTLQGAIDLEQQERFIKLDGPTAAGGSTLLGAFVVLFGCANTEEFIDRSSGGADELAFTVLT